MLDGLIHAYLDTVGRAWQPRDAFPGADWDSLLPRSALSSSQQKAGETDAHHTRRRGDSSGYRIVRVRYSASAG
ncbi:hypothetical protein [Hyphomonas sp.]|uniref:hypothetical protein n=1 Tax=Hyphomonas sp. TaxID=87 RepID=UPI0025BBF20E|nr:hypothetical protein [Hyphomonas sp.]